MEWTNRPNDGYYWTDVPKHSLPEIVKVFGGQYCCVASAWNRPVNGKQLFFGPIPYPSTAKPPVPSSEWGMLESQKRVME